MIIETIFSIFIIQACWLLALFFLFFLFTRPTFRAFLLFLGFSIGALIIADRYFNLLANPFVSHSIILIFFSLLLVGFSGKKGIINRFSLSNSPPSKNVKPDFKSDFKMKKIQKRYSVLPFLDTLPIPLNTVITFTGAILFLISGIMGVIRGLTKHNVFRFWIGAAFISLGLGEIFYFLTIVYKAPLYLSMTTYVMAIIMILFGLWKKSYLNLMNRMFLSIMSIGFFCLTVTSILFIGMLHQINALSDSHLFSIVIGTLGLQTVLFLPCWFIALSFTEPLRRVIAQTKSLKEGKLELFKQDETNIEYNKLFKALNIMVGAIDKNREDLETQIVQLQELDKLREEFLANVSHELRTPLTMIIGNTELLLGGLIGEITEEQMEFLQPVYDEAHKLLQLITDVLNFSQIERGVSELRVELINIQEMVNSVLEQYYALAKHRKIQVIKEVPPLNIGADPEKLNQILVHLIGNAIKFNGKGGKLRIRVKKLKSVDGQEKIQIEVADTGIGLRPELLSTIFEKFRQGDGSATREHGGTGIGLTIVKSFVEQHGGKVDVKSVVGKGSIFIVTIPHHEVETQQNTDSLSIEQSKINKQNILIVLIEADLNITKLLKTYLIQDGFNALALSSGQEALDQLNRLNPDIICLNPKLPDLNGWEVMKRIKHSKTLSHIPIVVVTVMDNRSFGRKMGAADFLIMPVKKTTFLKSINSVLSRSLKNK